MRHGALTRFALCLALLDPDPARRPTGAQVQAALGDTDAPAVARPAGELLGRKAQLSALRTSCGSTLQPGSVSGSQGHTATQPAGGRDQRHHRPAESSRPARPARVALVLARFPRQKQIK